MSRLFNGLQGLAEADEAARERCLYGFDGPRRACSRSSRSVCDRALEPSNEASAIRLADSTLRPRILHISQNPTAPKGDAPLTAIRATECLWRLAPLVPLPHHLIGGLEIARECLGVEQRIARAILQKPLPYCP